MNVTYTYSVYTLDMETYSLYGHDYRQVAVSLASLNLLTTTPLVQSGETMKLKPSRQNL